MRRFSKKKIGPDLRGLRLRSKPAQSLELGFRRWPHAAQRNRADYLVAADELFERGNQLVVRADLPGLKTDDLKLEVADSCLTVEGGRRDDTKRSKKSTIANERWTLLSLHRAAKGVDPDSVNATFHDGVLE